MTAKPVHFSHHVADAMGDLWKALDLQVTRPMLREILAIARPVYDGRRGKDTYWAKTARFQGWDIQVSYTENAKRLLVVSVYVVGEYD